MTEFRPPHLSDEVIFDLADQAFDPEAATDALRHARSCAECARRLRRARRLFARLEGAAAPNLERDLAPGVIAGVLDARKRSLRFRWLLAAQAIAATAAFAALGLHLTHWIDGLRLAPAFLVLRDQSGRLAAEAAAWLAPFLSLIPSHPVSLASFRVSLPHLGGPALGWAGLAAAAVALGVAGNALLLRSADLTRDHTPGTSGGGRAGEDTPGRRTQGGSA